MLKIFNTLSRKKEEFKPICPGKVGMYVCGITIYDLCHIGHGRTFVVFDAISRYLRYLGYNLHYVRNVTDIDDKIIKRAAEHNQSVDVLTNFMLTEMHKDCHALNILPPDSEPRATFHIKEIIEIIEILIKRGHAYLAHNGDVMFEVKTDEDYGKLSGQNLEKLQAGARVKIADIKRNPMDFVLWKMSKISEPSWKSPWGLGRPGWHIECSAMNIQALGRHFDIHGGGADLIFPHHDNEIAQSSCAYDDYFVNYWMHAGMVMINHEKMSKSLYNVCTIRDLLEVYDPETVRYFFLSSHYRSQLKYTETNLKQAHTALERIYTALRGTDKNVFPAGGEIFTSRFEDMMNDDFNIPKAYSVLFDMVRQINCLKLKNMVAASQLAAELRKLGGILGLLEREPETFLQSCLHSESDKEIAKIEVLIKQRNDARKTKQWILADKSRNELTTMGIVLEDSLQGTTWRRK
ncbi:Cysteine--tRNA ligase [Candidatus Hartigia pinicola]|nr:Cysteine--tRNA ligase [Candidatus Hartigia pinicola]